MPFFGLEVSSKTTQTTPCCLLKNDANVSQIRAEMLDQKKPEACAACWKLEDQGIKSDRQYKNQSFDLFANKDIKIVEEECKNGIYSNQIIKIYTSNLCNSTCVTCGPIASSSWSSIKKMNTKHITISNDQLNPLKYNKIKMLSFVGGEPLYDKKTFEILNCVINAGNTNCFISIVTNGSVVLSNSQLNILKKFKNLNLCISIDGIESRFEYIRYPLKWQTLLDNLELFKSIAASISISYTISNLNLMYYNETSSWFKEQNLNYNHNIVTHPSYFSINSLPEHVKETMPAEVKFLLRPHIPNDDSKFNLFAKEIQSQDNLKNISIQNFMPEMYKIIQENTH
jgi:hypothetical protein